MLPRTPTSTHFPYTTLFRSGGRQFAVFTNRVAGPQDQRRPRFVKRHPFRPLALKKDLPSRTPQRPDSHPRSEEHTSELQSHHDLVCRLLLEKKKKHKPCHFV